jgi:predicted nucleic acid-binding protein
MTSNFFLDTNIFVYSFDRSSKAKQKIAESLIRDGLESGLGTISYQVIQEFLNVAQKKFAIPLDSDDAKIFVSTTLRPMLKVQSSVELFCSALDFQKRYGFSYYDSLIVCAATVAGCKKLYTEDMQAGFKIGKLEVINPF